MFLFAAAIYNLKFLLILSQINFVKCAKVEASKSEAWGPGLEPTKLVFPARYFFVKLHDELGNEIQEPVKGSLEVHISGQSDHGSCKVWYNILPRKDGSYIICYKLYSSCYNLKIDLRFDNMPIQGFPKVFSGIVYSDDCNCPRPMNDWLADMKCEKNYKQITEDLKQFNNVNFSESHEKILKKFTNHGSISLCHYVIKSNEVFRKCYGEYVDFKIFMDAILLSLSRKVYLPDTELFVNLGDWPLEEKKNKSLPIFSWCGSKQTADIIMPTYDLTEATLECMGRVARDMLSVQANTGPDWNDKINKAFWRGRDSSLERLHLVELSRKFPDYINASLTNFFFFRKKEKEYGPKSEMIPFYDFFQYKYQINLDGTVAAYRLPFLLVGDSVVLKQDSDYFEHFYNDLVPNTHYVPIKKDLSNVVDVIKWLRDNDDVARNISMHAQEFARSKLMPKDVLCYYVTLLKEWSTRLIESPKVLPTMEHVTQITPEYPCTCRKHSEKDEL